MKGKMSGANQKLDLKGFTAYLIDSRLVKVRNEIIELLQGQVEGNEYKNE
ncbi:MAG: hypothetical protein N4A68_07625 [Maledivibacter sp.]|jgi:hypothetical protein|nr:hypothetical protein [Maledivibacter sp.]